MISVSNVTMRYGSKILFEDVSTQFISGRRYGLTGPNGAGKSTFMKVLTGELEAQKGIIVRPRKLGILRQDQYAFDAYRVIDTVIMGNAPLWAALEERENLYNKAELTDEDGSRLGELEGIVGDENGYEAEAEEIQDLYLSGKKKEAEAKVPLELLEQVNLVGPASYVKERIEAFRESGVTNLQVTPVGDDPATLVSRLKEWVA